MTIFKALSNIAEVIFYYLILFGIALVNIFISVAILGRSNKSGSSNREPLSGNESMVMGSVN